MQIVLLMPQKKTSWQTEFLLPVGIMALLKMEKKNVEENAATVK